MQRKSKMRYDPATDRWNVELQGRHYGLRCGETFALYIGDKAVPCSVEMDLKQWYVIMEDVRFHLRTTDEYVVSI